MPFVFTLPHTDEIPLTEPLTKEQVKERIAADPDGRLAGTIVFNAHDLAGMEDLEERLDALAEALCGSPCLEDFDYSIVGLDEEQSLAIEINGDAHAIIEEDDGSGSYEDDILCDECGQPMVVNDDGTTNHVTGDGVDVDHDADADHVAIAPQE